MFLCATQGEREKQEHAKPDRSALVCWIKRPLLSRAVNSAQLALTHQCLRHLPLVCAINVKGKQIEHDLFYDIQAFFGGVGGTGLILDF